MAKDRFWSRTPDFSDLAPVSGKGANKTADWTDMESRTPTLPFVRDGVHSTADWSSVPGAQGTEDWTELVGEPKSGVTADWSFEPGTGVDAPRGGDGANRAADWSVLLED